MDHLNHYMHIQQQRFGAKLKYTLEFDESLLDCPIPKLTLQPIVENAFIHGLDMKSGQWHVQVKVYAEQEAVCIHIRDNGVGMDTDKLIELRRRLDNSGRAIWTRGSSIGIQNVATRIRMHFGLAYGVTVESRQDLGTAVTVRIPVKLEEENNEPNH
ncbi:Sensor histidine kinase YpdA [compost metagenome]